MLPRRCFVRPLWLLLTLLMAGCQVPMPSGALGPGEAGPGEVAFELAGPGGAALVVPVRLNGKGPFNFVLDTGATFTCVDESLAKELALPERRGQVGFGAGVKGSGQVRLVAVNSLEVGTAKAADLTACALDLGQLQAVGVEIRGLVGLNFLKEYRVTLDFEKNVLKLEQPPGRSRNPQGRRPPAAP
jgi:predicted aspartyl protease